MKKFIILVLVCLMVVGFNSCVVTDGYVYDSRPSYIYYTPAPPRPAPPRHHHNHKSHHKPAPPPKPASRPRSASQPSKPKVHSGARPNSTVRK